MKNSKKGGGRNLHAIAPIMRKGGVHQKSESAERAAMRRDLKKQTRQLIGRGSSADADHCKAA